MSESTEIHFVRQHHEAKRAGIHKDYRVVIGDKAFSWASRKDFPEVGKPTLLWEQPVHHAAYLNNPDIVIPDGQYGAGTQVIDYAQKGKADVYDDAYHLELNNGDRFLIKKAPEHYGEKAWLFLRKKKLEDTKNPYLEKLAAEKKKPKISPGAEILLGAGTTYVGDRVAYAGHKKGVQLVDSHRTKYMAKANAAGTPMSKEYMSKLKSGAKTNVRLQKANTAVYRGVRGGTGVLGSGLALHGLYRSLTEKKASERNPFLEKFAALGDADMNSARSKVNDHLKSQGKAEISHGDFKDYFKSTRGVSGRVVGTVLGGVVPIAGNIAGYYVGKSIDNSNAKKEVLRDYGIHKYAAEVKNRDNQHGWRRAGTVLGTTYATGAAAGVSGTGLLRKIRKQESKGTPLSNHDVDSYMKSKGLGHVGRHEGSHFTDAHYSPFDAIHKGPYVQGHSPEALLHEYGHAHSFNSTAKKFGKGAAKYKYGSIIASQKVAMGLGGLAGAYAATSDNEKVRKYAPAAVAASTVPLMVEEARASLSPIKHLYKTKGAAAAKHLAGRLAPAYGTYVAAAGAAVGAASWAKHIKNKAIAKANKKAQGKV